MNTIEDYILDIYKNYNKIFNAWKSYEKVWFISHDDPKFFSNSSLYKNSKIFSFYNDMTDEEDDKLAQKWFKDYGFYEIWCMKWFDSDSLATHKIYKNPNYKCKICILCEKS